MTTSELNTLLTGLWAKVKSHVTTAINGLAAVATSGSYNDLTNKPTIPDTSTLATKSELANFCPIIEDTRASSVVAITGVAPFASLTDGQRIVLHSKYSPSSGAALTLNLTLSDGNTTGAKNIKYISSTNVWTNCINIGTVGKIMTGVYYQLYYDSQLDCWKMEQDLTASYSLMPQSELTTGTSTVARLVTPSLLRSNFYLKSEAMAKRTLVTTGSALTTDTYVDLGTTDTIAPTLPASPSRADEFVFCFTCVSASPNITLPQGVALADGFDWSEADAGVQFQVSIQDGIAAYLVLTPNT